MPVAMCSGDEVAIVSSAGGGGGSGDDGYLTSHGGDNISQVTTYDQRREMNEADVRALTGASACAVEPSASLYRLISSDIRYIDKH